MATRQRAPEPPPRLIEQIRKGKVVPFIGAGFSKSAQPKASAAPASFQGMPTYWELLNRMLELARLGPDDEEDVRRDLKRGLYDKAASTLREAMGDVPFYMSIRDVLESIDWNIEGSLAHKLLGFLAFRRIVTINYDRLLERFTAPGHEVITPMDQEAFGLFMNDEQRGFILKLHGDITRPDTIPWGKDELLRYYGFDSYNRPLPETPKLTRRLRRFLEELFEKNTVLFLGTAVSPTEGFVQLLTDLVRDWNGSLPHKHYALVPYDQKLEALRSEAARKLNLEYIYYHPDEKHTQLWEFLSFLKAGRPETRPEPGREWEQWFNQSERPQYLLAQLEREKTATSVRYLTPKLTNAIAPPEYLSADCREELQGRYDPEVIDQILAAMSERAANLDRRARQEGLEVRILFLEAELRKSLAAGGDQARLDRAIARYRHLLELVDSADVEVRVIPDLTAEDLKRQEASFALIFNRGDGAAMSDVTLAYSSQATNDFPEIHRVQINTSAIWQSTFTFERFWAAARNETETRSLIQRLTEPDGSATGADQAPSQRCTWY